MDGGSPLQATLAELRDIFGQIASAPDARKLKRAALLFTQLKEANRRAQFDAEASKAAALTKRHDSDRLSLLLQNIGYEKAHIQREIQHCRTFVPKNAPIDLVGLDEFFATAPAELRTATMESNAHQLHMNRLNFELQERKRLKADLQQLHAKKKALSETIAAKTKFLDSLQTHLQSIAQAAAPLREHFTPLDAGASVSRESLSAAARLPVPLYVLFRNASAYRFAHAPHVDVSVEANAALSPAAGAASTAMEVDDGAAAAASHTTSDASVVLSVGRTPRLRLRFRLLQPQNIIGVSVVEGPLRIESLSLLFAGDTGVHSPNPASAILGHVHTFTGSERPFVWAQRLAGLSGELPLSHTTRTAVAAAVADDDAAADVDARETMHTVVERLEARLRTTAALTALLTELTSKRALPANLAPEAFPVPEASRFTVAASAWSGAERSMGGVFTSDDAVGARYMRFVLTANDSLADLEAIAAITADFPARPALFRVQLRLPAGTAAAKQAPTALTVHSVKSMEWEVNIEYSDGIFAPAPALTLQYQLRRLQMCFDIFAAALRHGGPPAGVRVPGRLQRGRDRRLPFAYRAELGVFEQRE